MFSKIKNWYKTVTMSTADRYLSLSTDIYDLERRQKNLRTGRYTFS